MEDFEIRFRTQAIAKQWVSSMMSQNGISPQIMKEALEACIRDLDNTMLQQYFAHMDAMAAQPESPAEEKEE
jgi:hypothetical protein